MRSPLRPVLLGSCLCVASAASEARAEDSTPAGAGGTAFGAAGQWVVSGDFRLRLRASTGDDDTHVVVAPSLDYFMVDRLSIGGHVRLESRGSRKDLGAGARVGYAFTLSDRLSIWPRGGLIYTRWSDGNADGDAVDLEINAPVLFHVVPHFFIGLGPFLNIQVVGERDTHLGLESIIGGYF